MDERNERLKEVYIESEMRSVTAFAKFCGINQKTMDNYIKGLFRPTIDKLELVLQKFPRYSHDWLVFGTGAKYNPNFVQEHYANVIGDNNTDVTQTINTTSHSTGDALLDEVRRSKDRIISRTVRKLKNMEGLNDISSIKSEIQELILDLEDEMK